MMDPIEQQATKNLTILTALKKGRAISHDTWGKLSLCITRGGHPELEDQPRQGIQRILDVMYDMDGNQLWRVRTDENGHFVDEAHHLIDAWLTYYRNRTGK